MTFVDTGRVTADITGSVEVTDPLTNLKRQYYDGTGYTDISVPEGKKWVIVGVGSNSNAIEGFIRATIGTGAYIYLNGNWGSPEYIDQHAQLPLLLLATETVRISMDGMISYYEYDA